MLKKSHCFFNCLYLSIIIFGIIVAFLVFVIIIINHILTTPGSIGRHPGGGRKTKITQEVLDIVGGKMKEESVARSAEE